MASLFAEDVRFWLRQQQGWNDLRTAQRNGWKDSFQRWRYWKKILRSRPLDSSAWNDSGTLELHTMCYGGDWLLLIWMLKSLHMWNGFLPRTVIHVQRQIKPSAVSAIRYHFPNARLILPEDSEQVVSKYLIERNLSRCIHWWHRSGIMHKLVAVQAYCESKNILWVDSDVLFYRRPVECFPENEAALGRFVFQRDCASNYTFPLEDAPSRFGVELLPCINTGIVSRAKDALDLNEVEKYLRHPEIAQPSGHMEQTLQALCACSGGTPGFFPDTYAINMDRSMSPDDLVCRHYAGPSKRWITLEGMRWLVRRGILDR